MESLGTSWAGTNFARVASLTARSCTSTAPSVWSVATLAHTKPWRGVLAWRSGTGSMRRLALRLPVSQRVLSALFASATLTSPWSTPPALGQAASLGHLTQWTRRGTLPWAWCTARAATRIGAALGAGLPRRATGTAATSSPSCVRSASTSGRHGVGARTSQPPRWLLQTLSPGGRSLESKRRLPWWHAQRRSRRSPRPRARH
mmetsp:Transcript_116514/g.324712  ORF Transcript_116514/g.324712 Transcript_116514/m.324712 type:complete len:203 (-) Transcript_116514:330-938(-)